MATEVVEVEVVVAQKLVPDIPATVPSPIREILAWLFVHLEETMCQNVRYVNVPECTTPSEVSIVDVILPQNYKNGHLEILVE